jgi:hypothetical protein
VPAKICKGDGQTRFLTGSVGRQGGVTAANIHQVQPVVEHVLTVQRRNPLEVFQGFDVLGYKSDFLEAFGVKRDPFVSMPKDSAKLLELQLSECILRVILGHPQLPVTIQDILSIQDVVNGGKCDPSDQELIHVFNETHFRPFLDGHFPKEKNLRSRISPISLKPTYFAGLRQAILAGGIPFNAFGMGSGLDGR